MRSKLRELTTRHKVTVSRNHLIRVCNQRGRHYALLDLAKKINYDTKGLEAMCSLYSYYDSLLGKIPMCVIEVHLRLSKEVGWYVKDRHPKLYEEITDIFHWKSQ